MYFGKLIRKFSILPNICYLYLFFSNNMYKLLVIPFVIKLYARNVIAYLKTQQATNYDQDNSKENQNK